MVCINVTAKNKGQGISRTSGSLEWGGGGRHLQRCGLVAVLGEAPGVRCFRHRHCRHVSGVENKADKLQQQNKDLHHRQETNFRLGPGRDSIAQPPGPSRACAAAEEAGRTCATADGAGGTGVGHPGPALRRSEPGPQEQSCSDPCALHRSG